MSKKSNIFLIIGLVLIAVLAGCKNEVSYPNFPTGGFIRQTGDFLTGQSFDSSKFEVVATYLDGSEKVIEGAVVTYADNDGIDGMSSGDMVSASVGSDYNGKNVPAYGSVTAYSISRLDVKPAESYKVTDLDGTFSIPESSLAVTAYYLDSTGAEQSMKLIPGEFVVSDEKLNGLSATNPSTTGSAKVSASVGKFNNAIATADFSFAAVYESPVVSGALQSITINTGDFAVLAMTNQQKEVTLDDVTVVATYETGSKVLTEEDGVKLQLLNAISKLPVTDGDYINNSKVIITAEYQGKTDEEALYIKPVAMVAYPVSGYTEKEYVSGADVASYPISAADFDVIVSVYEDSEYKTLDYAWILSDEEKADVEFFYYTDGKDSFEETMPTTVGRIVYVGAVYNGVTYTPDNTDDSRISAGKVVDEPTAMPVKITAVELASEYQAPRSQHYTNVAIVNNTLAINAVQSLTIEYDNKESLKLSGFTADNLAVEYSLTSGSVTELDKDSLADVDTIYIHVIYYFADENGDVKTLDFYEPVKIEKAYATSLDIDVEYAEKTSAGAPLYGTGYTVTVNAVNANGVVAVLTADEYTVDGDLPETVTAATSADGITVNALVDSATGKTMITGKLVLATPVSYVKVDNLKIQPKADAPKPLINTAASRYFGTDTVSYYEIVGFEGFGGATVEFDDTTPFIILKTAVTEGTNTVYANVKYIGENGTEVTETVKYDFQGIDWVQAITATLKDDVEVITGQTYTVDMFDFDVTLGSGKEYTSGIEFAINGSGALVAGTAGRPESVVFDYTFNGVAAQVTSGEIVPVADYPSSVNATQVGTIWRNTVYTDDLFSFDVTWASGLEYEEGSEPSISYTYEPTKAEAGSTSVTINWACGTAEGQTTAAITLAN